MTISLVGAGAAVTGSTALTPAYPTNAVGDRLILWVTSKPFGSTVATPSGWTLLGSGTNGTTAAANDAGSMFITAFYRDVTTVLSGTQAVTVTSGDSSLGVIQSWRTDGSWSAPVWAIGSDTTSGTGYSAASTTTVAVAPNDFITTATGVPSDAVTHTAQAFTQTGATFTGVTETIDAINATNTDSSMMLVHAKVATGSVTATLTLASTLAAANTGITGFVRLRDIPPSIVGPVRAATVPVTTQTAASLTSPTFDVQSGDLVTIFGFTSHTGATLATTWTGTETVSLTDSVLAGSGNFANIYLWTIPVTATATGRTVTISYTGGSWWGYQVTVWRNHGGIGNLTPSTAFGTGAPSASLTTSTNSAVEVLVDDWNAVAPTTRNWLPVNGKNVIEVYAAATGTAFTAYTAYVQDVSAGTATIGLSAPTGQSWTLIGLEIRAAGLVATPVRRIGKRIY